MARRMLTTALFGFGVVLGVGALAEILLALDPGLLPLEATAIPFMAAHRTSLALRTWMIGSNLLNLSCGLTFVTAAVAIARGLTRGWRRLRLAAAVLTTTALAGVPICLVYLLPLPSGPAGPGSLFLLLSVVSAALGLATVSVLLFRHATRALARATA